MYNSSEADVLFKRLDLELMENIDSQYFSEPREFRSLNEVLEILGQKVDQINKTVGDASKDLLTVLKDRNPAYSKLLNQRKIVEEVIEDVVKFQHGGLNNSVDTMSEVVREYTRGRDDIQGLRKSLFETQAVLTAKKVGQVPLKELWQKKVELQESLRMVKDLESLKSAPHRIQRLIQQKRYLTAVNTLNKAITVMFGEDLVGVGGLSHLRQQLMDMKETVLETCVAELKSAVVAAGTEQLMKDYDSQSDSEEEETADNKSTSARSYVTSSHINDEVRTIVSQSAAGGGGMDKAAYLTGAAGIRASLTSGLDTWPVDLRDLDESLESSLADPSAAGSLYIRLLVRAIGVLEAEADVERMVLDGVVERFKESSLRNVRENAAAKLTKELALFAQNRSEDDDELSVHTRLFTSFIGCLLDSTLLALRRMLYLMKLLYMSKAMSAGEGGGYSGTAHIDVDKYFKEQSKRQVLSVWMGMEDLVVLQMLSHLVEPDVQDITDSGTGRLEGLVSKYGSQGREGFMLLEKGDDGAGDGEVELIFTPTARHAAPIFRRVVVYSQLVGRIMKENNLEDARQALLVQRASAAPKDGPNKSATTSGSILDVVQVFLENELIPVIQSTVNAGMREIQLNSAHFSVVRAAGDSAADLNKRRAAQDVVPLCPAAELCCTASKPLFSYWLQLHQHRSMVSTVLDRLIRGFASAAKEELENLTYNCLTVTQDNMHASLIQATKLDPLYRAYRAKIFGPNKYSVDDLFALPGASSADSSKSLARRSFMPSGASTTNSGSTGSPQRRSVLRGSNAHLGAGWEGTDMEDAKGRNALEVTVWEQLEYWDVGNHNYPITSQKIVKDFLAVGTIASISYACDWLIKKLSGFSAIAARKISSSTQIGSSAPAPSPALTGRKTLGNAGSSLTGSSGSSSTTGIGMSGSGLGAGGGGGGGVAGSRASTVVAYKQSQKAELHEQKMLLITTVVAGTKELSKIAEEGMALLRGELQLICFYFLHRLSHVVYSPPSSVQLDAMGGKRKSFSSSSPLTAGRDFNNSKGNSSPTQRSLQQNATQGQGQGQGQAVSAEEGLAEEEAILSAFNDHLRAYLQAVMSSTSSDALAALLSPLCSVIPRILTHCAMHMVSEIDKANSEDSADDHFSPTASADHYLKTHLLRMVVSVQQSFALHIQSYGVANETKRRLLDLLTDGFERSRRFITMFGMPASELKAYLKSNSNDYSKEEVEILWMKSTERDVTFVQLWKELETIPRTGPRAAAALQFAR